MDGNSRIHLDPDVPAADMAGAEIKTPLSDLYELPVFAADTVQKAGECRREEMQMLEQFRKGIFETDGQGGEEWIWNIYNQIFRAVPRSPASESAAEGALAPGIMSEGFTLQPHSLTGTGRETEALPGAFLLPGVMVIGMILRFFRGKGKRRH